MPPVLNNHRTEVKEKLGEWHHFTGAPRRICCHSQGGDELIEYIKVADRGGLPSAPRHIPTMILPTQKCWIPILPPPLPY